MQRKYFNKYFMCKGSAQIRYSPKKLQLAENKRENMQKCGYSMNDILTFLSGNFISCIFMR